jgi:isopenicillin-N epimerase
MPMTRRQLLASTGLAAAGVALSAACRTSPPAANAAGAVETQRSGDAWDEVRSQFRLSPEYIHMSALLIASHPQPVRDAIERYRDEIDAEPVLTLTRHNRDRRQRVLAAAGRYLGVSAESIALTDSTTMGLGLVYNGLRLREGQEILTTQQDYFVTHEAIRQAATRSGGTSRQFPLYDNIDEVSEEGLAERIAREIRPDTRVLALTWVHSSTGLKLPLKAIAEAVSRVNRGRDDEDRVLLSIDGVHGFGIEDLELDGLGLDFFSAGCHKWLFGPRGTGLLWASDRGWAATRPSIPSFVDDGVWSAWLNDNEPDGPNNASRMTPGGFKAFEHQWAMAEAFDFHVEIGKRRVQERTHELNRQLKEGLASMNHVRLVTPMADDLSSGLTCFDVNGINPWEVVDRLREKQIIASVTPYAVRHARLTPSIRNTPEEVDRVLSEIRALTT